MSNQTHPKQKPYWLTLLGIIVVFGLFFLIMFLAGRGGGGSGGGYGSGHGTGMGPGSGSGSGSGQGSGIGTGKGSGIADRSTTQGGGAAKGGTPAVAPVAKGGQSPVSPQKELSGAGNAAQGGDSGKVVIKRRITSIYNPGTSESSSGSSSDGGNAESGGGGGGFYGIKVRGNTLFVVDVSGSMSTMTKEHARRIDILKAQLKSAIRSGFMDDLKSSYRIIAFSSGTVIYPKTGMKNFSDGYDKQVASVVSNLTAGGSTSLHGAVIETVKIISQKESNVDSIFLLTDGEPTDSSWKNIQKEIRTSISKEVVIHCISIGRECQEMEQIAKEYKGTYRAIQ